MSPTSYQTAPPRGEEGYLTSANDHSANDWPSAYGPRDIGIPIDPVRSAQKEEAPVFIGLHREDSPRRTTTRVRFVLVGFDPKEGPFVLAAAPVGKRLLRGISGPGGECHLRAAR